MRPEEPNQFTIIEAIEKVQKATLQPFRQTPGLSTLNTSSVERRTLVTGLCSVIISEIVVPSLIEYDILASCKKISFTLSSATLLVAEMWLLSVGTGELVDSNDSVSIGSIELLVVEDIEEVDLVVVISVCVLVVLAIALCKQEQFE